MALVLPPILKTARLLLRPFHAADIDAYAAMCADPEVMRFVGTGETLSRSEACRSIAGMRAHWQLRGYGMWAIQSRASGEFLGRVGFVDPPGWPAFELGCQLVRAHWGRGYATESVAAARDYALHKLGRSGVIGVIHEGNERSVRLAERLGATHWGDIPLHGRKARVYQFRAGSGALNEPLPSPAFATCVSSVPSRMLSRSAS